MNPDVWNKIVCQCSHAQQHEPRKSFYRLMPLSFRSIANYPVGDIGFHECEVGRDRHADPVAELIHISALERLGVEIQTDNRKHRYMPKNLLQRLGEIEATYDGGAKCSMVGPPKSASFSWSGDEFNPKNPPHQAFVQQIVVEARKQLR